MGGALQDVADLPAGRAAGKPAGAQGGHAVRPGGVEGNNVRSQEEEIKSPGTNCSYQTSLSFIND